MSNMKHYEAEIRRAGLFDKDSDFGGLLGKALMKLCESQVGEGHSWCSQSCVVGAFNQLMNTGILSPLTGEDDEWNETGTGEGKFQNKRASNVFKGADGRAYQYDYYVFHDGARDETGYTGPGSRKYITFPFVPKHEHIVLEPHIVALKERVDQLSDELRWNRKKSLAGK
jgi:hypothetical protein